MLRFDYEVYQEDFKLYTNRTTTTTIDLSEPTQRHRHLCVRPGSAEK